MDEMIREMERFKNVTSIFTFTDVALVLSLGFVLSLVMGLVYRATHQGTSYSQSCAQTLVIMGMVTALIMLIIGSNIARAFSLIGALSVIRFRNAVKETRDVGFMFLVMAIGMACGTRFYMLATFATAVFAAVLGVMYKLDLFSKKVTERILRLRLAPGTDHEAILEPVFQEFLTEARLVAMESVAGGVLQELVYVVMLKRDAEPPAFLHAVQAASGNNKAALVMGQQEVDATGDSTHQGDGKPRATGWHQQALLPIRSYGKQRCARPVSASFLRATRGNSTLHPRTAWRFPFSAVALWRPAGFRTTAIFSPMS